MKPMSDGSVVVGLFNRQSTTEKMTANLSQIGLQGEVSVRDLWLKKDVGNFRDSHSANVPRHGVVLVRIKKK